MGKHTTFRIGGPAGYFLCPDTPEALKKIVEFCNTEEIPWFILGNGSNLLVSDRGLPGSGDPAASEFSETELEKDVIRAQAGALLSAIAAAAPESRTHRYGVRFRDPRDPGGARVVMNAGAYGGEIRDILTGNASYGPGGQNLFPSRGTAGNGIPDQPGKAEGLGGAGGKAEASAGRSGTDSFQNGRTEKAAMRKTASGISQRRKHL